MRNTLLALCLLQALRLTAGGDPLPMGARAAGMGYTGLATADLWSLRLNPAGIAGLEQASAGLFYQQHFLSGDLAQQGLAFALPVGKGALVSRATVSGTTCTTKHVSAWPMPCSSMKDSVRASS
jgi:hypothetical protein